MAYRKLIICLIGLLLSGKVLAQRQYYIGLDIGPKFDQYKAEPSGSAPYTPNIKITNPLGATFGVVGGAILEDNYNFEVGIFKSDYKFHVDLIAPNGVTYFKNTPINTFTTYMIPVHFNKLHTWQGKYDKRCFVYGTGFTLLAGNNLGINETYTSPRIPINPLNSDEGEISYTVSDNVFDAKMIMLNLNLGYQYPINEFVNVNLSMNSKIGVAGSNFINISHSVPNTLPIRNTISSTGTSIQFNIGFRYFIDVEETTN